MTNPPTTTGADVFEPPRPSHLPPIAALARTVWRGDGDLLSLLPAAAYRMAAGELGYSRRSIKLFNDPALVREILSDDGTLFPKSDLMVGALEPLIGRSIFVSDGEKWRRQRAMIDPAFSMMRLGVAFNAMTAAVDAHEDRLAEAAARGEAISLDLAMSHLTADIICRTVFSVSLQSAVAKEVFDDFAVFERGVGQVRLWRLIASPAWAEVPQESAVLEACARIRRHIGALIDTHLDAGAEQYNDIAQAVVEACDAVAAELLDDLVVEGLLFVRGHAGAASGGEQRTVFGQLGRDLEPGFGFFLPGRC